jgi:RimJ/RimL family protein N-acetyltransferase
VGARSSIRLSHPNSPAGPDTVLLLGEDGQGLGAAILFSRLDGEPNWSRVDFRGIAVARRLRGQGGAHAREALDVALTEMQGRAQEHGVTTQFVLARIHRSNLPSQRLCASAGFTYLADMTNDLQYWSLTVDL